MNIQNVMILGNGGREHALAFFFARRSETKQVFVFPGNDGMEITPKVVTSAKFAKFNCLKKISEEVLEFSLFCEQHKVDFIIVGSELPLSQAFVDRFVKNSKIPLLGPSQAAAMLETSKDFSKNFMNEFSIPTAKYISFKKEELLALSFDQIENLASLFSNRLPVVKASGLCAGKGVIVPANKIEFHAAIKEFCTKNEEGFDASQIILEECLTGPEVSLFYLCQGENFIEIGSACDYKRWGDQNTGPNTGGMGAYLPPKNILSDENKKFISTKVIAPLLAGMMKKGTPYNGILFVGAMITEDGPKVIEFNCRFGDPETQCLIPLMPDNFAEALYLAASGRLLEWILKYGNSIKLADKKSVHVVMTHAHYAGANSEIEYSKNLKILMPENFLDLGNKSDQELFIFSCALKKNGNDFFTNGGRIIGVTALANSNFKARTLAYQAAREIYFEGRHMRSDIANNIGEDL